MSPYHVVDTREELNHPIESPLQDDFTLQLFTLNYQYLSK